MAPPIETLTECIHRVQKDAKGIFVACDEARGQIAIVRPDRVMTVRGRDVLRLDLVGRTIHFRMARADLDETLELSDDNDDPVGTYASIVANVGNDKTHVHFAVPAPRTTLVVACASLIVCACVCACAVIIFNKF